MQGMFARAALLLAALASGQVLAAEFTLRLNHTLPAVSIRQIHAELFRDAVAKSTGGRVEAQIFPAGQLYRNDQEAIKALRSGSVEGAMVTTGDLALFEPAFNIYEAPFLYRDYAQLEAVIRRISPAKDVDGFHSRLPCGSRNKISSITSTSGVLIDTLFFPFTCLTRKF